MQILPWFLLDSHGEVTISRKRWALFELSPSLLLSITSCQEDRPVVAEMENEMHYIAPARIWCGSETGIAGSPCGGRPGHSVLHLKILITARLAWNETWWWFCMYLSGRLAISSLISSFLSISMLWIDLRLPAQGKLIDWFLFYLFAMSVTVRKKKSTVLWDLKDSWTGPKGCLKKMFSESFPKRGTETWAYI